MNKIEAGNLTRKGAGRPKGAVNKVTAAAKDAIAEAAEQLGGVSRLVSWAKEDSKNEHAFWASIYPKLLPLQVSGNLDVVTMTKEQRDAAVAAAKRADS